MNLVLETFERVLYPGGGAATRRASTSGLPGHYQHPAPSRQQTAIGRRRSGGINAPSQPIGRGGGSPLLMSSSNSYVAMWEPLRGCSSEREVVLQRDSPVAHGDTAGSGPIGATTGGSSGASSRSRSGARRKKSSGAHPRKQSVASLLFAAISASAPANHRRRSRHPPPRQWSVPERGPGEPDPEEEPFQLVRKAPSLALPPSPCSQQRTPPRKQLSSEEITPDGHSTASSGLTPEGPGQSVLLGFVVAPSPRASFRFGRMAASDHHSPAAESPCLAQCGRIRQWPSLSRALLLRSVDPETTYPYLHYAVFDGNGQSVEVAEEMNKNSGAGNVEFGSFEEVVALERQSGGLSPRPSPCSSTPSSSCTPSPARPSAASVNIHPSPSSAHHGFIVMCFRLLDGQAAVSAQLESTWLSWTGAHEIYKYSPRAWQLRRLSLHRRVPPLGTNGTIPSEQQPSASTPLSPSSPRSFAYVLLCEFGAILHPSNALAALDMCERLRARNCGLVSLFQVRHCYGASAFPPSPNGSPAFASPSSASGMVPNSLSPNWSPHQLRRGANRLARMGHSQDVPDSGAAVTAAGIGPGGVAGQRRQMFLRMRERSLGWDMMGPGTAL